MSQKRPTESGWDSDEELLTETGISAFKEELDELDEDALLGDDDVDDNIINQDDVQDDDGMLQIQAEEEDIDTLAVDDEEFVLDTTENEQLDYHDDTQLQDQNYNHSENLNQETDYEAHVEEMGSGEMGESDMQDFPNSEEHTAFVQDESHIEQGAMESEESDSDESDRDKHERGRFRSERANIVSISKAKSRSDIPDTLEVSEEQQAQIESSQRDQQNRKRGGGPNQRKGGRNSGYGNREPVMGRNRMGQLHSRFQHPANQPHMTQFQLNPPFHLVRHPQPGFFQERGHLPQLDSRLGDGLMAPPPRPLMQFSPQQGNRILVPNQQGGFNMVPQQQAGPQPLLPGQVPPGTPAHVHQQQAPILLSQSRPGVLGPSPSRPHKIHINPNFRGQVSAGSVVSLANSMANFQQQTRLSRPEQIFSQSNAPPGSSHPPKVPSPQMLSTGNASQFVGDHGHSTMGHLLLGQSNRSQPPFNQTQGQQFQQQRQMGNSGTGYSSGMSPQKGLLTMPGHLQPSQHQQRFGPPQEQGMVQHITGGSGQFPASRSGVMGLMSQPRSASAFSGQRFPSPQSQQNRNYYQPQSQQQHLMRQQLNRMSAPQQGPLRGPSPQQMQQPHQEQRQLFTAKTQQRMMLMQQKAPQKNQTVAMAKKLAQQARVTQQAKAQNKNITVVPLLPQKRQSTESASNSIISPKVARISSGSPKPAVPPQNEELIDEELRKGLEQQKRLRELVRKRKEEARRKQAEARRRELEARLANQGLTIEDIEKGEQDRTPTSAPETASATTSTFSSSLETVSQGAQPITTVVSRGAQQQQQQKFQPMRRPSASGLHAQKQGKIALAKRFAQTRQQSFCMNGSNINSNSVYQQHQQQFEGQVQHGGLVAGLEISEQFQQPPQPNFSTDSPTPVQNHPQSPPAPMFQQPKMTLNQRFQPHFEQLNLQGRHPGGLQNVQKLQQFGQHSQQNPHQIQQQRELERQNNQGQFSVPENKRPQQFQQQQHQYYDSQTQFQQTVEIFHQQQQQQFQQEQQHVIPGGRAVQQQSNNRGGLVRGGSAGRGRGSLSRGRGGVAVQQQRSQGRGQVLHQIVAQQQHQPQQILAQQISPSQPASQQQALKSANFKNTDSQLRMVETSSPKMGGSQLRTVLSGVGKGVQSPSNRTVLQHSQQQRQVIQRSGSAKSETMRVAGPSTPQNVSIDNLSASTTMEEIRSRCEAIGPVTGIVMLESQRKAIVTFSSKVHAATFVKTWNRRMINLSLVSVSLLP